MNADPYDLLGVAKTATDDEIKKAYRKLAKEHHPDLNPGNKEAEEKFKAINEAYDKIKTAEARAEFDLTGNSNFNSGPFHGGFYSGGFDPSGMDFSTIEEMVRRQFASNPHWGPSPFSRQPVNPDVQVQYTLTMKEAFEGKRAEINIKYNNQSKDITIDIPPGIDNGMKVVKRAAGFQTNPTVQPGNILVAIKILPDAVWERDGAHLARLLKISVWDAMMGGEEVIETICGKQLKVKIHPGTQDGQKIRISGYGMPLPQSQNIRGDMFLITQIEIPRILDEEQKKLILSLKNMGQKNQ